MKKNKDKTFIVRIPATAKPMEVQAFNNLRRLGYRVETTSAVRSIKSPPN